MSRMYIVVILKLKLIAPLELGESEGQAGEKTIDKVLPVGLTCGTKTASDLMAKPKVC